MWIRKMVLLCSVVVCTSCAQRAGRFDPGAAFDGTLIPDASWSCGMPEGIPRPDRGVPLFTVELPLDRICDVGETPYGDRAVFIAGGGQVSGPRLNASVVPGGLDFQLTLSNGIVEVEQLLVFRTDEGEIFYVRNAGVGLSERDVRVVVDIEAPNDSPVAWLNSGRYVADRIVNRAAGSLTLVVYDVSNVSAGWDGMTIPKPNDHPPQPWDDQTVADLPGRLMVSERVTLGAFISVGASKRGVRHIIPITGGEVTGDVTGSVLSGGADFQLQSDTFTLDARYLWETEDGDVVIVRNAGTMDSLIPVFEARVDGPCAWLNQGTYRSGEPEGSNGAVLLNLYRSE